MFISFAILFLVVLTSANICYTCPLEYYTTDPNHSYCIRPYPGVRKLPLTSSQKLYIVHRHNVERESLYARDMQKMYWNDELADIAQNYALACQFEHDEPKRRSAPRIPISTGQNLAMGYQNWTLAIDAWIEEKEFYHHGYPSTGIVGHYTQIIWNSAVLVGCGAALCPAYGQFKHQWPIYVCNYITGQLNSDLYPPYDAGHHYRPLHDCGGKVCLYNGTLNLETCQCECSSYASGNQCEYLDCNNLPFCPFDESSCFAINVPLECPRVCGLCDRYEVLKYTYGSSNLSPTTFRAAEKTTKAPNKPSTSANRRLIVTNQKLKPRKFTTTIYEEPIEKLDFYSTTFYSMTDSSTRLSVVSMLSLFPIFFYCII